MSRSAAGSGPLAGNASSISLVKQIQEESKIGIIGSELREFAQSDLSVHDLSFFDQLLSALANRQDSLDARIIDGDSLGRIIKKVTELIISPDSSFAAVCKVFSSISKLSERGDFLEIDLLTKSVIAVVRKKFGASAKVGVAMFLNAAARLGYEMDVDNGIGSFLRKLQDNILVNMASFQANELAFLALSMAKLGNFDAVIKLVTEIKTRPEKMSNKAIDAMMRADYSYQLQFDGAEILSEAEAAAIIVRSEFTGINVTVSLGQKKVAKILKNNGYSPVVEGVIYSKAGFQITADIVATDVEGVQYWIEYDGETHLDRSGKSNVATKMRDHLHQQMMKVMQASEPGVVRCLVVIRSDEFKSAVNKAESVLEKMVKAKGSVGAAALPMDASSSAVSASASAAAARSSEAVTVEDDAAQMDKRIIMTKNFIKTSLEKNTELPYGINLSLLLEEKDADLSGIISAAIEKERVDIIERFIAAGLDPEFENILSRAIGEAKYNLAASLIIAGADISAIDSSFFGRLAKAIGQDTEKYLDLVDSLLNQKIEILDFEGSKAAIKLAITNGHNLGLVLLRKHSAAFTIKDIQDFFSCNLRYLDHDTEEFLLNKNSELMDLAEASGAAASATTSLGESTKMESLAGRLVRIALDNDDPELMNKVLDRAGNIFDINKPIDGSDSTLLYYATMLGKVRITKFLLEKYKVKIDLNKGNKKTTPLCVAIDKGHYDIVQCLLESGADPNIRRPESISPLMVAVGNGDAEMAKILFKHSEEIRGIDDRCDHEDIKDLLGGIKEGVTPLQFAVYWGDEEMVTILLENNANPGLFHDCSSVLHIAAHYGNMVIVKDLLSRDIDINVLTVGEDRISVVNTVICSDQYATADRYEMVSYLLGAGYNPNLGDRPLSRALSKGYIDIAKLLVEREAEVRNPSFDLRDACSNNKIDVVRFMLEVGADPNSVCEPDKFSPSFLKIALVKANNSEMAKLLMSAGADPGKLSFHEELRNRTPGYNLIDREEKSKIGRFFNKLSPEEQIELGACGALNNEFLSQKSAESDVSIKRIFIEEFRGLVQKISEITEEDFLDCIGNENIKEFEDRHKFSVIDILMKNRQAVMVRPATSDVRVANATVASGGAGVSLE